MVEAFTIPRSLIDPEEFRGRTFAYEWLNKPGHTHVGIMVEPLSICGGKKVSIIRDLLKGDGYLVSWDVVLKGGVDQGLKFGGMEEELKLRLLPPPNRRIEESITGDDNKRYWGS